MIPGFEILFPNKWLQNELQGDGRIASEIVRPFPDMTFDLIILKRIIRSMETCDEALIEEKCKYCKNM